MSRAPRRPAHRRLTSARAAHDWPAGQQGRCGAILDRSGGKRAQPRADRHEAPEAVRHPADDRRADRLAGRRGDERRADGERAGPELVEPQRPEDPDRREHDAGQRRQPHPARHAGVARGASQAARIGGPRALRGGKAQRHRSQARGEQGVFTVLLRITAAGSVEEVEVIRSSGYAALDDSARRAVQRWRFHHTLMAAREIGSRQGTGGSRGVEYLRGTVDKRFYDELWAVRVAL